ncbi:MAG TPA: MFS transporter [Cellulomonas sp.]|nr:MFS transporter [Cellulomonas sp.]
MTTSTPPGARALTVWGAAVAAYAIAVLHRSSLGVAGLETASRFGVSASVLASLAVAQLVVYAAFQIPVGVLLDRLGPRRIIAGGAFLMAAGQLVVATATVVPAALLGRMFIGAGDAMTFVCVIRLIPAWFPQRRVPLMTQLTGSIGQLGQVLAAVPLVAVLQGAGWGAAFGGLAAVGLLAAILVVVVVRDSPASGPVDPAATRSASPAGVGMSAQREGVLVGLRAVAREPGAWLGFWVHFLSAFSTNVVVLLWGFSFFVEGQGRTTAEASALLTLNVVAAVVAGPLLGEASARHPERRTRTVLVIAGAIGVAWLVVLVPSGPRPLAVLAFFVVAVAVGGPTSLVGFDVARHCTPAHRLGATTGFVNTGSFVAALSTMLAIGVVLDHVAPGTTRDLDAYRQGLAVVAVPWVMGVTGLLVTRRRTRAAHPDVGL